MSASPGVTFYGPVVICRDCGKQHGLTKRYRQSVFGTQLESVCTGCEPPRVAWLDSDSVQMRLTPLAKEQERKAIEWVKA